MSTVGRKPRGFKKPPISLSVYHLLWLDKIRTAHHQPDRSAAVRWLIDQYAEGRFSRTGPLQSEMHVAEQKPPDYDHAAPPDPKRTRRQK